MAPRGTKRSDARARGGRAPIDHTKVIDGFGELTERTHYERREVRWGRCSRLFTFEPAAQKYVHEVRGVPVKMAERRAAYCDECLPIRVEHNRVVRRRARLLRAIEASRAQLAADPSDADAALEVARAHLALLQTEASVKSAERLVALARRAHRLDRERLDALYWEGRALEAAGHSSRAMRAYQTFLEAMRDRPGHRALVTDASARLARTTER